MNDSSFYINLVKVQTVLLLEKGELHSFPDGGNMYYTPINTCKTMK